MNDLLKHFIAGAIISSIVCAVTVLILGTDKTATDWALGLAFVSAFFAGLAKELYDKYIKKTYFDISDMIMTWFGSIVPIVVWGVIQNYV
jgi:hypothetical protein